MSQLKDIAVTMMYIYFFVITIRENHIINLLIILIIGFYIISVKQCNKKLIKKYLTKQREFFINSLSHDLRIPTIAQIRALELINREKIGPLNNTQKEMLFQIEESCRYNLNLMSLMINTYDFENNPHYISPKIVNVYDIISSCLQEHYLAAKEKNISFDLFCENKQISILADKNEIKKVVKNMLFSAISDASSGESISVNIGTVDNKIRLTITDTNNNQICSNTSLNSPYTPVGQNIRMNFCKKIIENYNGQIFKSRNPNSYICELPQAGV